MNDIMRRSIEDDGNNKEMNEYLLGDEKIKLRDKILLSPYTKFLLPSLLIGFLAPITVYIFMISPYAIKSSYSIATCNIKKEYQIECIAGTKNNITEIECEEKLCCWDNYLNICYHTVPSKHGYEPQGGIYYDGVALNPREKNSPLESSNIEEIYLDIKSEDENHVEILLSIIKKTNDDDDENTRIFKSKNLMKFHGNNDDINNNNETKNENQEDEVTKKLLYFLPRDDKRRTVEIELENSSILNAYVHYPEFSVTITRNDENFTTNGYENSIFSTARGPLILTENYWEWTFYFNDSILYGLNDIEINGTKNWIYNNENGTIIPAFLSINPSGEAAAYYIDYKGPLEVQVLNISNLVILRGLSIPENLSVHIFAGPSPQEAVSQLGKALKYEYGESSVSERFNYGLHICPNSDLLSIEETLMELNETIVLLESLKTPWDSHCINERFLSTLNHLLDTDDLQLIDDFQNVLESTGRFFSPHLSPMVLLQGRGNLYSQLIESQFLLTMNESSDPYVGFYQNSNVVYPDWENLKVKTMATSYLTNYINDTRYPDSVWIRDSWPKDELNSSSSKSQGNFTRFDYIPKNLEYLMNNQTVPYDLTTNSGSSHHKTHNSYSQGFRTFVRSLIPTIEFLGPPGESGNTTWNGLRRSISSAVGSGIVGLLPPANYICGTSEFTPEIHEELCIRWYQAAVTWPNIIVLPDRLPGGTKLSASASSTISRTLRFKASLSTYQRTVTANFFIHGTPCLAPTYFYYPHDILVAYSPDQFIWGEAILVGLVTLPGVSQVEIHLPNDEDDQNDKNSSASWKHLMGGSEVTKIMTNQTLVPVTANIGELITLVRPGRLVPIHKNIGDTTRQTISSNLTLAVNLNCNKVEEEEEEEEESCFASGEIYYGVLGNETTAGDFLKIQLNRTHLNFDNLNSVKIYACDDNNNNNNSSSSSNSYIQSSTFIEIVELLGGSVTKVNTELCDLEENNVVISLI